MDGQTDRGDCNISNAFLKRVRGDNYPACKELYGKPISDQQREKIR